MGSHRLCHLASVEWNRQPTGMARRRCCEQKSKTVWQPWSCLQGSTNSLMEAVVDADVQSCARARSCQAASLSCSLRHGSNAVPVHVETGASASSSLLRHPSTTVPVHVEVEVKHRKRSQSLSAVQQQLQGLVAATRRLKLNQAVQSVPQSEHLQPSQVLWSTASDKHSQTA